MPVIAVANQKGGVGKTTTSVVLATLLSRAGHPVHLIDMDPQASATSAFGYADSQGLLYEALSKRKALPVTEVADNLTLTGSSIDLARGESQFMGEAGREFFLRKSLEKTKLPDETIVLIDCPPSLGVLGVNCLTAAEHLLIVVQPGGFEIRALAHLQETVEVLRERINHKLNILGAVLTNCNVRRLITADVHKELAKHYPFLGLVRSDAQLLYATTEGRIIDHEGSNGMDDYERVARKLIAKLP